MSQTQAPALQYQALQSWSCTGVEGLGGLLWQRTSLAAGRPSTQPFVGSHLWYWQMAVGPVQRGSLGLYVLLQAPVAVHSPPRHTGEPAAIADCT